MSKPIYRSNDIECPECHITDTVRLLSKINSDQFESVIWCVNGHIGFLDRHDRWTLLTDTGDIANIMKMTKRP